MLSNEVKQILNQMVPSIFTVNGQEFTVAKTFGSSPLGDFTGPTINFSVIKDGTPHRKFIGELVSVNDVDIRSGEAQTSLLRYKVAALDTKVQTSEEIVYRAGTGLYTLRNDPVLRVITPTENVTLREDRRTVALAGFADGETVTVSYEYIESGYWIASEIATQLRKEILANIKPQLTAHSVDVLQMSEAKDISAVFVRENVYGFAFDVQVVYTYYWSRSLTEEDGPLIGQVDNTLIHGGYSETTTFE